MSATGDASPFLDITLGNILTWIISVLVIMGAIWRAKLWQEKREEIKANALVKRTEDIAESLMKRTEEIATSLKEYTNSRHQETLKGLDDMQNRMTSIIDDLRDRADLTNGNVANIRTDIADLQEDLIELWESQMALSTSPTTPAPEATVQSIADKKRQSLDRKKKRRKIESDRITQNEQAMELGKKRRRAQGTAVS